MKRTRFSRGTYGVSLVILAIWLVALLGVAALALDLGMLLKVRAEAQRTADAAALAGASAYLLDMTRSEQETLADTRAREVAGQNTMAGVGVDPVNDVTVEFGRSSSPGTNPDTVKVRVRKASVPVWFARIFGWVDFPVGARAVAVADYASGAQCIKPIAIADLWDDSQDADPPGNHVPDPGETWLWDGVGSGDVYVPANPADGSGTGFGSALRGADRDWGRRVILRPSVNSKDDVLNGMEACPSELQGGKCYMPGWWGWWGDDKNQARDAVLQCDQTTRTIGVSYPTLPGETAKILQEIEKVYALDPNANWVDNVADPIYPDKLGTIQGSTYGTWPASPRVWTVGVFRPDSPPPKANSDIVFNNFVRFFFEGCTSPSSPVGGKGKGGGKPSGLSGNCAVTDWVVGRFVGIATGVTGGPSPGPLVRALRLVG